jgi:thiamine biosynthesis lipoprotein
MTELFEFSEGCMGTVFTFKIGQRANDADAAQICKSAMEILHDADTRFSLYKPNSEISHLDRGELDWVDASPVQREIRDQCTVWKERTGGYFDAVSPDGRYDPSGLVKTWAALNACNYLEANGFRDFTLNAGGDVYLSSQLEVPILKRVGISNLKPIAGRDAGVNMILELHATEFQGVATSGSAERGEHIWRKSSGEVQFQQVTVVAKDLVLADIWATAIISGGLAAMAAFSEANTPTDAIAIAIDSDLGLHGSAGAVGLLARL